MPGPHIQCGPCPLYRNRVTGACDARRRDIAWTGFLQWLGNSDGREQRGAVQPDFLSQRLDLAARQSNDRAWLCPVWFAIACGTLLLRDVGSHSLSGLAPLAGIVLRLHP